MFSRLTDKSKPNGAGKQPTLAPYNDEDLRQKVQLDDVSLLTPNTLSNYGQQCGRATADSHLAMAQCDPVEAWPVREITFNPVAFDVRVIGLP
jgi:hypothetical protein